MQSDEVLADDHEDNPKPGTLIKIPIINDRLPFLARLILFLCLVFASGGAGYYLRVRAERTKPIVIQQVQQQDRARQVARFTHAAKTVADSARLGRSMETAIYVDLVERLKHPCPLPDHDLRAQCENVLTLARALGQAVVIDEGPGEGRK